MAAEENGGDGGERSYFSLYSCLVFMVFDFSLYASPVTFKIMSAMTKRKNCLLPRNLNKDSLYEDSWITEMM